MNEKLDSLTPEILSLMEPKATQVYGEIRDSVQTICPKCRYNSAFC